MVGRRVFVESIFSIKSSEVIPISEAIFKLRDLKDETRKYSLIALQDYGYDSKALKPIVQNKEKDINRMLKPYSLQFEGFRDNANYAELFDPANNPNRWIDDQESLKEIAVKYDLTVSTKQIIQPEILLRDDKDNTVAKIEPSYIVVSLYHPITQKLLEDLLKIPYQML